MRADDHKILVAHRIEQAKTSLDDGLYLLEGKRSAQSVINRSYYSMYYAVIALLQNIGKVPSKHSGAIGLFDTEFVMKNIFPKELSKDLHKAFELRQTADYQIPEHITVEKAAELLVKAKMFVEKIESYLHEIQAV